MLKEKDQRCVHIQNEIYRERNRVKNVIVKNRNLKFLWVKHVPSVIGNTKIHVYIYIYIYIYYGADDGAYCGCSLLFVLSEDSDVCKLIPFHLFTPFICCLLLSVAAVRELKTERKKTKKSLDSNFLFEVFDFSVMWMFS